MESTKIPAGNVQPRFASTPSLRVFGIRAELGSEPKTQQQNNVAFSLKGLKQEKLGHLLFATEHGGKTNAMSDVQCAVAEPFVTRHLLRLSFYLQLPRHGLTIYTIITNTERADNYIDITIMAGRKLYVWNHDKKRDATSIWCRPS